MTAEGATGRNTGSSISGLRVYCSGPIRGDVTFAENYRRIVDIVSDMGAATLTEIGSNGASDSVVKPSENDEEIYRRDMEWLRSADCVIAEVSAPSHGAGFEICYALFSLDIPVLLLHWDRGKRLSAMLEGCDHTRLELFRYSGREDMATSIGRFLEGLGNRGPRGSSRKEE